MFLLLIGPAIKDEESPITKHSMRVFLDSKEWGKSFDSHSDYWEMWNKFLMPRPKSCPKQVGRKRENTFHVNPLGIRGEIFRDVVIHFYDCDNLFNFFMLSY